MKKLLLSCLIGLGMIANAQISVYESFEGTVPSNFTATGGYSGTTGVYTITPQSCDGAKALGTNCYGGTSGGRTFTFLYTQNPSVSNGKKINWSFDWMTLDSGFGGVVNGSIQVSYSRAATGNTWTNLGSPVSMSALTSCTNLSGIIEESTSATTGVPVDSPLRFRVVVTTPNGGSNDYLWLIDTFKLDQESDVAPSCTTVTLPADGANPNGNLNISWTNAAGASGYKLYVGTEAENYDVLNGDVVNGNNYSIGGLAANTTYYIKVIPTNAIGDAQGCSESSFTTGDFDYCSPVSSADNSLDYITNVNFAGIDNTTTQGDTSYSDFTTGTKAMVTQGETKTLSVSFTGDPGFPDDHLGVLIDWNGDKIFSEDEAYPLVAHSGGGTFTTDVVVPNNAVEGDTRMRVVLLYNTGDVVITGCESFLYGEVEDYTVNVSPLIVAPTCTTITSPEDGATNVESEPTQITWTAVEGADGYKVYIGTATGNYDIVNGGDATATQYEVVLSADTQYFVKVVAYNTAGDAADCSEISFTTAPTLAVSGTKGNSLSLYPNPFHEVIKISDVKNVYSISVNDMAGRKVKTLAPAAELNLSSLKEGVYIVNLQMKDGSVQSFKVIKK